MTSNACRRYQDVGVDGEGDARERPMLEAEMVSALARFLSSQEGRLDDFMVISVYKPQLALPERGKILRE